LWITCQLYTGGITTIHVAVDKIASYPQKARSRAGGARERSEQRGEAARRRRSRGRAGGAVGPKGRAARRAAMNSPTTPETSGARPGRKLTAGGMGL